MFDAYESLYTPGSKTGVFYHEDMYVLAIRIHLQRQEPPKQLSQPYMLEVRALFFPPHHPFYEVIDKKLQQLIEGGLIGHYRRQFFESRDIEYGVRTKIDEFKVLTLEELEAGFAVSLIPLAVCFSVFCIECLTQIKLLP